MPRNGDIAEVLPWDSGFWGVTTARLARARLSSTDVKHVDRWCHDHSVDLMYYLCPADDHASAARAENHRWRYVGLRLTLERTVRARSTCGLEPSIRPVRLVDLPALETIAGASHRNGRFHADPRLANARCDELYRVWIRKDVEGQADLVLVAERNGRPAGYLSAGRAGDIGTIRLVAVAEAHRGHGLGRALIRSAVGWFAEQGLRRATVVTHGGSPAAQRVYQALGFRTESMGIWFHRWFEAQRGDPGLSDIGSQK